MPLKKRQAAPDSPSRPSPTEFALSAEPLLPKRPFEIHAGPSRTLTYRQSQRLVPWQTDNEYVLTGYRKQAYSVRACVWSAVSCGSDSYRHHTPLMYVYLDLHNETGQIEAIVMTSTS